MTVQVIAAGLPHPETVARGPDGALYTGIARGHYQGHGPVMRVDDATGQARTFVDTGGRVLGIAAAADQLVCCDVARQVVEWYDLTGRHARTASAAGDRPLQRPNGCVTDQDGGVWFTDSGTARAGEPTGAVCFVPPRGPATVALDGLVFPNGIGLSPDGTRLYVTLTRDDSLIACDVLGPGRLSPPRVVRDDLRSGPDGLTVARTGDMVVALTRTSRVVAVTPGGELTVLCEQPDVLHMPSHAAVDGTRVLVPSLFGDTVAACGWPGTVRASNEGTQ